MPRSSRRSVIRFDERVVMLASACQVLFRLKFTFTPARMSAIFVSGGEDPGVLGAVEGALGGARRSSGSNPVEAAREIAETPA